SAVISNPRTSNHIVKVKVRPIMKKGTLLFQLESYSKTQVFHKNLNLDEIEQSIVSCLENFRQMQMDTRYFQYTILISKKGKITIQKKQQQKQIEELDLSHNRSKKYILEEGVYVPFLEDLGVMNKEGKIIKSRFDKFRQMNRFLEFIEDILPKLPTDRELTILDFGCGKSYLTFAMYYYLHELKGYDVRIIGLDLKTEVIAHCNQLQQKYGYEKLIFLEGNIEEYKGVDQVDMVVTLHACDTATDFALAKAVGWNARVILSVPCCQHELNGQISNELLSPILKYGLIKERIAALVTDALRGEYLEREGYDVQILEFIDMEHTPKNILIRGVRKEKQVVLEKPEIKRCESFLNLTPTIGELLKYKGE
ncbi:MAG: SAM-dependent methyltransferase, partial [Lachnospiraceae bacterium]